MADIDIFLPYLRLSADNCPEPILRDAVLRGSIEFCRLSGVVRALCVLTTAAGETDYVLATMSGVPAETRVGSVSSVSMAGKFFGKATWDEYILSDSLPSGQPNKYTDIDDKTLGLVPVPDGVYTLKVDAVIEPARTATTVPDVLADEWFDGVLNLARSYVLDMPATAWNNPQAAMSYRALGEAKASEARLQAEVGRIGGEMRVRPQVFGQPH